MLLRCFLLVLLSSFLVLVLHYKTLHGASFGGSSTVLLTKTNEAKRHDLQYVRIFSFSSIGDYLWLHLLEDGRFDHNYWANYKIVDNLNISYRESDQAELAEIYREDCNCLVLILQGGLQENANISKFLQELTYRPPARPAGATAPSKSVVVIYQGNDNWLLPHMKANGGPIDALYLTEDNMQIDDKTIFQWPRGVSTSRKFPLITLEDVDILTSRPYVCSFFIIDSDRSSASITATLARNEFKDMCFVKNLTRSQGSAPFYMGEDIQILSDSDLMLCPFDESSPSSLVYEALSLGSVPVVLDSHTSSGLRMLKSYRAPLVYIRSWEEDLRNLLLREGRKTLQEKIVRRAEVMNWYHQFRKQTAEHLLNTIKSSLQ